MYRRTDRRDVNELAHAQEHGYPYAFLCALLSEIYPCLISRKIQGLLFVCVVKLGFFQVA